MNIYYYYKYLVGIYAWVDIPDIIYNIDIQWN